MWAQEKTITFSSLHLDHYIILAAISGHDFGTKLIYLLKATAVL